MSDQQRDLAVEYLLGELDDSERADFEDKMKEDAELSRIVDELKPVVSKLGAIPEEVWDPPQPPALVMPGVAPDTSVARPRQKESSSFFNLGWMRLGAGLAATCLVMAVGVLVGVQLGSDGSGETAAPVQTVVLDSIDVGPPAASGEVLVSDSAEDAVTLDVSGLTPTADGEFYELWLLGDGGELVALGSFRIPSDGQSKIDVPLPVSPDNYEYFDVSIQEENGDPAHSGRSVLRGMTRA